MNLNFDKDVSIIYQGGSCGFLLYFLILLSGKYCSGDELIINSENTVSSTKFRISQQFPIELISSRNKWKENEIRPDNNLLKYQNTNKHKLFLICNPLFSKNLLVDNLLTTYNTLTILIYTDLDIQLRMAFEKNAYWFTDISRVYFDAPLSNLKYIKQIKSNFEIFSNNRKVDPLLLDIKKLFKPTVMIDLFDLIHNREHYNDDQKTFLNYWLSLQSPKVLKLLKYDRKS